MTSLDNIVALIPAFSLGLIFGLSIYMIFGKRRKEVSVDNLTSTVDVIKSRRSIAPKNLNGKSLTSEELDLILEAANWAPTHKKTEPWRYSIFVGNHAILDYLDFIENWYRDHCEDIPAREMEAFTNKLDGIRREWPSKVSHLLVIGMKRGEGLPEWEELCAVAMSVQNMHLVTAAMEGVGGFWSSHTWCKRARESPEMRRFVGLNELAESGDRILGAFVLGRFDPEKKSMFKSTREDIKEKIQWRY